MESIPAEREIIFVPDRNLARYVIEKTGRGERTYDIVLRAGARVVKLIGDEVMFVTVDADAACRAALALMDGFVAVDARVVPRGGVAFGNVLVRGGDYYGPVVNLASRLVDEAVPEEVLATTEVRRAATDTR